ncbi:restriction endonuclease [Solitalea longa]|uniref:Restriction endonuclease n=1 Tax=Solitalea longa TaxID=2079460 RepID=A0A2S4ZYR6_9SPHI|nr:restriction endonuclease subunit S [Solitalea longa]POY35494.1 restriction endonuclease [Solitalea longa]
MTDSILKGFEVWSHAQGVKSRGRVKSIDNISLEGIIRLRELIKELALQGRLIPQDLDEESGSELLKRIDTVLTSKYGIAFSIKLSRDNSTLNPLSFRYTIPDNWTWCELQDIAMFINGKAHEQFITEEPNYILINSRFVSTNGSVKKYTTERLTPLFKGDIAIVMSDVPEGIALVRCCIVEEDNKYTLNQRIGGILTCDELSSDFLALVLDRNRYYLQYDDGKKQTNLKKIHLLSCPIPLPPLAEQKRIVAKVNELMVLCDQLEVEHTNNLKTHQILVKTLLETLTQAKDADELQAAWQRLSIYFDTLFCTEDSIDQLKQTVLQLAIMGRLVKQDPNDEPASELVRMIEKEKGKLIKEGKLKKQSPLPKIRDDEKLFELPINWEWVRLGEFGIVFSGASFNSNDFNQQGGTKVIKITNAGVGKLVETDDYLPTNFLSDFEQYVVNENDLILALTRPYIAAGLKISKCPPSYNKSLLNQRVASIRLLEGNNYVFLYLQSSFVLNLFIERFGNSGLQPNLKIADVTNLVLPIPPLKEQQRIMSKVDQLFALCDQLKERIIKSQEIQGLLSETIFESAVALRKKLE